MAARKFTGNLIQQRGVVLIVSLVFLIALTAVAAALMQNTTTDIKMSGATEEEVVATQQALSASDEVIYNQVQGATNNFAQNLVNFPVCNGLLPGTKTGATGCVDIRNNDFKLEAGCPHSRSASSTQVFTCNVLRLQVNRTYGRTDSSNVEVNTGIAQQLLSQ